MSTLILVINIICIAALFPAVIMLVLGWGTVVFTIYYRDWPQLKQDFQIASHITLVSLPIILWLIIFYPSGG